MMPPLLPLKLIQASSKNKLLIMRGTDPKQWQHRVIRGYALMVMGRDSLLQCSSCYKMSIRLESLYGYNPDAMHHAHICAACLTLPTDYTIFEVKIVLKRKSSKHPSGIRTEYHVSTVRRMKAWMRQVDKIYPGSTAKHLYDNLYQNSKGAFEQSERLSYILKTMWDFLPEVPIYSAKGDR